MEYTLDSSYKQQITMFTSMQRQLHNEKWLIIAVQIVLQQFYNNFTSTLTSYNDCGGYGDSLAVAVNLSYEYLKIVAISDMR